MKRIIFFIGLLSINVAFVFSQKQKTTKTEQKVFIDVQKTSIDSTLQDILVDIDTVKAWLEQIELDLSLKNRYKIYQTENIYNLIKLDTKTGRIYQLQWSLDSKTAEGTWTINGQDLTYGNGYGSGSFELYPTKNMYQFILLDKTDGRTWHVQWGIGDNNRWIKRIY
ncbi:MAG: hypothetical protein IJ916_11795 [Paludibacteraceae bacterium]|nr:hypothetical protein [Paludibacteraceae bacterium]